VNLVIKTVALGTHDDDAEVGAMAKQLDMTTTMLGAKVQREEPVAFLAPPDVL
jgi:hypothetical protein